MWDRLTPTARQVMSLALEESEQFGHGYVGDEHVILGLLHGQASQASSLLRRHGLDLARARAELQRLSADGLMPRSRTDEARALRSVGIDVETVRGRLVTVFGRGGGRDCGVAGQPTAVVARRRPAPHAAVRAAVFR